MADCPASDLEDVATALRRMHFEGTIPEGDYFKGLLGIANEWMHRGDLQEASRLVCLVSSNYLTLVLPAQMEADATFKKVGIELACGLACRKGAAPQTDEDVAIDLLMLQRPTAKA